MIVLLDKPVNTPAVVTTLLSTNTAPSDLSIYKDGAHLLIPVTFTNLSSSGICSLTFTPTTTGNYTLFGDGKLLATVEVTSRSLRSYLQNLEDESIGSWLWNKTTGSLELLRQDGSSLANFNVVDTLTESSRERI